MEDEQIIIKKHKVISAEGGHGGSSWKVAYADFVTAMMAFFLLLWLITMVSPEKQAQVSQYFEHFSIYEKSGFSFMEGSDVPIQISKFPSQRASATREAPIIDEKTLLSNREQFSKKLEQDVEIKLSDVKDQVMVRIIQDGVKVELIDKDGSLMFPLGSAELSPKAREIIAVISQNIKTTDSKIAIEGHTDALSYATNRYTNWELSTERASAARKELENNGLDPDRIIRVSGHAAMVPLIRENAFDPRNRRISVVLFDDKAE